MALSLDDLIAQRDALVQARMTGISEVRDAFRSHVVYKTDSEMASAIAAANEAIASAGRQPITTIRFITSKGL